MSRKKLSIHDVLSEDRTQYTESETPRKKKEAPTQSKSKIKKEKEPVASVSPSSPLPSKESKADYVRLSVTLPPDLFDRLQMLSIARRRRKEPYTFCHLVREAIQDWIEHAEEE